MSVPGTNPARGYMGHAFSAEPSAACELCGKPVWLGPYTHEVFDASDVWACNACIEDMLDASTFNPGAEMGLARGCD